MTLSRPLKDRWDLERSKEGIQWYHNINKNVEAELARDRGELVQAEANNTLASSEGEKCRHSVESSVEASECVGLQICPKSDLSFGIG